VPTAMKLAKTSPAMPVLRRKKSRKKLVWGIALGVVAVAAVVSFFLLRGRVALSTDERALLNLINEKRSNNRVAEVTPNAALCAVARRHSQHMCEVERAELPTVAHLQEELETARYPFENWGILIQRAHNLTPTSIFNSWIENEHEDERSPGAINAGELKSLYHAEAGICVMSDPKDPTVQWVTVVFGRKKQ